MSFGKRIQTARKAKGLTQNQLAQLVGVATGTIQQYELDKREPKIETFQKIAEALGVSLSYFFPTNDEFELKFTVDIDELKRSVFTGDTGDKMLDSIIENYHQLNEAGQQQLAEQAEGLTYIPKYKKRDPASDEEVG